MFIPSECVAIQLPYQTTPLENISREFSLTWAPQLRVFQSQLISNDKSNSNSHTHRSSFAKLYLIAADSSCGTETITRKVKRNKYCESTHTTRCTEQINCLCICMLCIKRERLSLSFIPCVILSPLSL